MAARKSRPLGVVYWPRDPKAQMIVLRELAEREIQQARADVEWEHLPRGCSPEVAGITIVAATLAHYARYTPGRMLRRRLRLARDDAPYQHWLAASGLAFGADDVESDDEG